MQASSQLGFRTHDESSEAQALEQQRAAAMEQQRIAQANQAQAAASGVNDSLSKVTDAEAQRDYNTAISLLRDVSANNLQNPEIHHRLAVNLLASGQISEAISEFRIASALNPTKKAYSDDLAQALAINKKSLVGDATPNGESGAIK